MRVPDPEDKEYYLYPVSKSFFDLKKYIKDFRKWKAELREKLKDQEHIFHSKASEGSKWFAFGQIALLKEILGEEASEGVSKG